MQVFVHTAAEATLALLGALAPLMVLVVGMTACANANRLRLTAAAERLKVLRVLLWMGVAIHEGGHMLACLVTLTRIRQVQVRWHSGFVKHDARGPLVSALIATGPIFSASLLAVFATAWLFGAGFAAAAAPFRSPLSADISLWTQSAAWSVFSEVYRLLADRWYVHAPLLLMLAGMLSSAAPSPPDLRNALPGLVWLSVIALALETGARAFAGTSVVALVRPLLREVTGALGIAGFSCLLGVLAILPLSLVTRKR